MIIYDVSAFELVGGMYDDLIRCAVSLLSKLTNQPLIKNNFEVRVRVISQ